MDLEKPSDYDRVISDPEFFFNQHSKHVIFDEAQECPILFPILRGIVDEKVKKTKTIDSNCLRSALDARNPVPISIKDRLDAVHRAQHVGKRDRFSVQNLDAFTLGR